MASTWRKKSDAAAATRARSLVGVSVNTSRKTLVVHLRQLEDAQAVSDGCSTDLVSDVQCSLVLAGQIAQEGSPIVAFEVVDGCHLGWSTVPRRPGGGDAAPCPR